MVEEATYSFGVFEFDRVAGELRKRGVPIRLQEQPCRILRLLLEQPGDTVTRDALRIALWPDGTFVEFERSLNAAVAKLRQALGDSAENPRYIETVARQGYRFVAPVVEQRANNNDKQGETAIFPEAVSALTTPKRSSTWKKFFVYGMSGAVLVAAAWWTVLQRKPDSKDRDSYIAMTRLTFDEGLTTDPAVSTDGKLLAYASDRGSPGTLHIWLQQLVPNGQTVQLTRGEWDEHQPAFSPDGSTLAFRSERAGGGIYLIPTLGGEARLLAKGGGRDPRFSPDGRTIAMWEPKLMWAPVFASAGKTYTVDVESGATRELRGLVEAGMPEWSPDGKHLIVLGRSQDIAPWLADWDWWVWRPDGGKAVATGAFALLKASGFELGLKAPRLARWRERELWFTGKRGDSVNVWSVGMGREGNEAQVFGPPRRLTAGNGYDVFPSPALEGRMVFAGLSVASDIWAIPLDANTAAVRGPMQKETQTAGPHAFTSVSMDGRLLLFSSLRYGRQRAMLKDLSTGIETAVSNGTSDEVANPLSKDGSLLAFTTDKTAFAGKGTGYISPTKGGPTEVYCRECMGAYDFSPDNKVLVYHKKDTINVYNLSTHEDSVFMGPDTYQQQYSPDGKWVVFGESVGLRAYIYVAPLRSLTSVAPRKEWIKLSDEAGWTDKPRWSPNGRWIYYLSNQDGFFCLWAQRLNDRTKKPVGKPAAIAHLHSSRLAVGNSGSAGMIDIAVARDKIAFNLGELTGNIWSIDTVH